jgi:hypothetical protein
MSTEFASQKTSRNYLNRETALRLAAEVDRLSAFHHSVAFQDGFPVVWIDYGNNAEELHVGDDWGDVVEYLTRYIAEGRYPHLVVR